MGGVNTSVSDVGRSEWMFYRGNKLQSAAAEEEEEEERVVELWGTQDMR
jgi:hypothetical protein